MAEFTSYAHGTPCWVDVTSPDLDGSIAFYQGLFGWEAERDPRPEAGGYTMFKKKAQGTYLISVCRNIACTHMGACTSSGGFSLAAERIA